MVSGTLALLLTLGLGAPPPDVFPMRTRHLEIPIRVNEAKRVELRELVLYFSTDQGRTWARGGVAPPTQQAFKFLAQSDGLFWFGVCAVDREGHSDPTDVSALPPSQLLKVLIDTTTPALRIVAAERVGDEVQLAWESADTQADPASLRLEYRAADQGPSAVWVPVTINPSLNDRMRFRPTTNGPITVRMQMTDSTGTPASDMKELPASPAAATSSGFAPAPASVPPAVVPPPPAIQQTNSTTPPAPAPLGPVASPGVNPPQWPTAAATEPAPPAPAAPVVPPPVTPPSMAAAPLETTPGLAPLPALRPSAAPAPPPAMTGGGLPDVANAGTPASQRPLPLIRHVRDRQVAVKYDVEERGPSGVRMVEVYITQDDGQTWNVYYRTPAANSELQLPLHELKEGQYGFRLVLYSGANQSLGPPRNGGGDQPDFRLLIDRTPPRVELFAPVLDPQQPNALVVRYRVTEPNLAANTVKMEYSIRPDGGWKEISLENPRRSDCGAGVEECSWTLPADLPDRVYFRLTARDQAGNVGEFVTRDPQTVDLHKPVARVRDVLSASQVRP